MNLAKQKAKSATAAYTYAGRRCGEQSRRGTVWRRLKSQAEVTLEAAGVHARRVVG